MRMRAFAPAALIVTVALAAPAAAAPVERRLHSDSIDASSFLWNDWNRFVENYHPNYVADDDPATAWVEGAKSSGAGEWLRIQVTPLEKTTRIRLRVRNGYQKSKDLWKANARAKAVTVRLLPSKAEKQVTLTDADGWQEVVVDQASGPLNAVELAVGSVYEGTKYADLCISDVQVLATSETPDNPAFEKSKLTNLMSWRGARIAAAKVFAAKKTELPIYSAYEVEEVSQDQDGMVMDPAELIAKAQKDPVFTKEWKDALAAAAALEKNLGSMTRAQLAPTSAAKLIEADGLQISGIFDVMSGAGAYPTSGAIRLPMLGYVSAMFADQLRVLDVKDGQTAAQYQKTPKGCGADAVWVSRRPSKEGPARVGALAVGRCAKMESRSGTYIGRTIEIMIYDDTGKLVLLVGPGHLEGYRWTAEGGKPMLAGGRSLTLDGYVVEAKPRAAVAKK
ncbi:MAG TPA: hypothetical protein VNO30_46465 [Kofleriaceae bacterium]|nr:hypothetical protein [Kofleriaceae bacterium]